jgi:hypothetical protein
METYMTNTDSQKRYKTINVAASAIYHCSLERAFKTAILCDVTKVHRGYGPMPRVTHCTDDEKWGQVGSTKKIYAAPSLTQPGGFAFVDKILQRVENKRWQLELSNFQFPMFGFEKFVGEWKTTELGPNKVKIDYTYTLYAKKGILNPFHWLFAKTYWRIYMKRVLGIIEQLALNEEPYMYP